MPRSLPWERLERALLDRLAAGPAPAAELLQDLQISQPSLSRLIGRCRREVVAYGNARHRRYALRRRARPLPVPVYEVDRWGEVREAFVLDAIVPDGLVVVGARHVRAGVYDGLPWFLQDVRPRGFLGQRVPDTLDHLLETDDLPGGFLFGRLAAADHPATPADRVEADGRGAVYAARVAGGEAPAGWVGGEHPKLLATRGDPDRDVPVIVKVAGEPRAVDLLVAEHLALRTLREAGHDAPPSAMLEHDGQVFLEVERFDRTPQGGRRAYVSLRHLHGELIGGDADVVGASAALLERGVVDPTTDREVRFREQFRAWIGDTRAHLGDVAFFLDRLVPRGLTPAYDVAPSAFAEPGAEPPIQPAPRADVAGAAQEAALAFWAAVRDDERISDRFRAVARNRRARLGRLRA